MERLTLKDAVRMLPKFARGLYQPRIVNTIIALRNSVEVELDLYRLGENRLTSKQVTSLREFLDKTRTRD